MTIRYLCYNIVITMQTQIIFQAGNSAVVAIPKDLMKDLKFSKGQKVEISKASDGESILIKKAGKTVSSSKKLPKVTAEFQKWMDTFMKENGEILDELAIR